MFEFDSEVSALGVVAFLFLWVYRFTGFVSPITILEVRVKALAKAMQQLRGAFTQYACD